MKQMHFVPREDFLFPQKATKQKPKIRVKNSQPNIRRMQLEFSGTEIHSNKQQLQG